MDDVTAEKIIQSNQRKLTVQKKKNERGNFMRIIEESRNGRNSVVIPEESYAEFLVAVKDMLGDEPPDRHRHDTVWTPGNKA